MIRNTSKMSKTTKKDKTDEKVRHERETMMRTHGKHWARKMPKPGQITKI